MQEGNTFICTNILKEFSYILLTSTIGYSIGKTNIANSDKSQNFHSRYFTMSCKQTWRQISLFYVFFNPEKKQENRFLFDPTGQLSFVVPSLTIEAADKAVKCVLRHAHTL